ncbi:unnamed protein product, partial [Amoebophrya sp. A25]
TFPRTDEDRGEICDIPCGTGENFIPACEKCSEVGICERCVTSLLGQFELSSDQKKCLKTTGVFWEVAKKMILWSFLISAGILLWMGCIRTEDNTRGL